MTVSSSAPRSMVVFAPISTSLPITTRPICGSDPATLVHRDTEPITSLSPHRRQITEGAGLSCGGNTQTNRGLSVRSPDCQRTAAEIGESDEDERCALFLRQLEPAWPPSDLS